MTITSDSYEAKVSEALVQMLADCVAFQQLVEQPDENAAKSFIVEDSAGEQSLAVNGTTLDPENSWAVVRLTDSRIVDRAFHTWGHEGDAEIFMCIRSLGNETETEAIRRARNFAGLITAELRTLVGASAARLAYATFMPSSPLLAEETGALRQSYLVTIAVAWRDLP